MVDVARLGLAVDSSQVEKGTVSLHQLTGAAGQASAAARQLAGASQAEAAGQRVASAATQAHTTALAAQNTVIRSSMHQRTMMIYQLNDVAVSLASGMNPAMVAMQQGSQILQGGLGPALRTIGDLAKNLVTRFWPLAAVVGAVGVAVAGLTHEINKASDVTVSFGDTALAIWQLVSEGIYTFIQPAVELIGGWFATAWDWVVKATKDAGNWIIRTVVGSIEYVKTSVSTLPAAFVVAGQAAAQGLADAIAGGVNSVIGHLNTLGGAINQIAGQQVFGKLDTVNFGKIEFGGAAAQQSYNDAWAGYGRTVNALNQRDIMGEMFGAISGRAQEIARARQEMDALGGSTKAANDNAKELATDGLAKVGEFGKSVLSTLSTGFADMFKGLLRGTTSVTEALSQLLGKLGDLFIDQAFNMLFGGLSGGLGGGGGGLFGWLAGLFGFANGGVFNGGHVQPFARGGIVNGPTLFPMANGAGLMGEAGPEAIMPLRRGPDGRLGVAAANQNGGDIHITNHINVPPGTSADVAPAIAREVTKELRKQLPDAIERHNRNPLRRAG